MPIDYGMLGIGALASATGVGASVLGSNLSYKKASRLMREQAELNYGYQTRWAKEGPSLNRSGLESAGYNPMLAVQNGTAGSNAGNFTSSTSANDVDLASPISSGLSNAMAYGQLQNQTAQTDSNIKLNEAQGRSAVADAIGKEIHNKYLDERERSELGKITAETTKLETDSAYNNALIQNLKDRLELDRTLGFMGIDTTRRGQDLLYNASTYSADKALEGIIETTKQSGTNTNKTLAGDIAKTLVGAGLAVFVGNKIKLIKPVGDLIKVIPKNILIK